MSQQSRLDEFFSKASSAKRSRPLENDENLKRQRTDEIFSETSTKRKRLTKLEEDEPIDLFDIFPNPTKIKRTPSSFFFETNDDDSKLSQIKYPASQTLLVSNQLWLSKHRQTQVRPSKFKLKISTKLISLLAFRTRKSSRNSTRSKKPDESSFRSDALRRTGNNFSEKNRHWKIFSKSSSRVFNIFTRRNRLNELF